MRGSGTGSPEHSGHGQGHGQGIYDQDGGAGGDAHEADIGDI